MHSNTLDGRFSDASTAGERLDKLPLSHEQKSHQVRSKLTPKAIYGAETSKPTETCQRKFTTVIKRLISNDVQHKSTDLTFCTSSYGQDLDPETNIFINRAASNIT